MGMSGSGGGWKYSCSGFLHFNDSVSSFLVEKGICLSLAVWLVVHYFVG